MSTSTGCDFEHADGAYVLGALSAAERLAFERHLTGCDACTARVRQLAGLPGLLGRVGAEVLDEVPPPGVPATLMPALAARVRREQRRRTTVAAPAGSRSTRLACVSSTRAAESFSMYARRSAGYAGSSGT